VAPNSPPPSLPRSVALLCPAPHVLPFPPTKFRLRSSSRPGALIGRKEAETGWKGASMDKCGLSKKRGWKGAMATRRSGGGPSSFP
uniref:Uncharacterized protein n=1 Tax=Triticum urartu TaxID=4572 RepID=A0A8R7P5T0_TRIUA